MDLQLTIRYSRIVLSEDLCQCFPPTAFGWVKLKIHWRNTHAAGSRSPSCQAAPVPFWQVHLQGSTGLSSCPPRCKELSQSQRQPLTFAQEGTMALLATWCESSWSFQKLSTHPVRRLCDSAQSMWFGCDRRFWAQFNARKDSVLNPTTIPDITFVKKIAQRNLAALFGSFICANMHVFTCEFFLETKDDWWVRIKAGWNRFTQAV